MTQEELAHYITKYKEHEAQRLSTNDRNKYWYEYRRSQEASGNK